MHYANLYNEQVAKEVMKRNQKFIDNEKKQSETPSGNIVLKAYEKHVAQNDEKPKKGEKIAMINYMKEDDAPSAKPTKTKQSKAKPAKAKPAKAKAEAPVKAKENRVDIVKRVMKARGVSMIEASKLIKAEGLY